ncbi:MAG: hypothetical protein IH840_14850 [Candidatus Heimdallarchaeota archaeon]|nr:hypothetical protein [Candidatus Heimdallarchaeota archaeon]
MSKRRRDARRAKRRQQQGMTGMEGMSSKQLQRAMSSMDTEEIHDVIEVIVRTRTEDIILKEPEVSIMKMGQEIWSVVPTSVERRQPGTSLEDAAEVILDDEVEIKINDGDVQLIVSSTNVDEDIAISALKKARGDIAAAIMSLS